MDVAAKRATIRGARAIAYAAVSAASVAALDQVPLVAEAVPELAWSMPFLTAALLALDKYVRARRAAG